VPSEGPRVAPVAVRPLRPPAALAGARCSARRALALESQNGYGDRSIGYVQAAITR
jgi:hypothetical protein